MRKTTFFSTGFGGGGGGLLHELLLAVLDDEKLVGATLVPGVLLRLGEGAVDDAADSLAVTLDDGT
ncbi:MAG: hypothetical protein IKP91_02310 [Bacteroidaceae bacterium]|nr:hypothetical protein [Bacteroidaceae bacterium]